MKFSQAFLAVAAMLALVSCGKKDSGADFDNDAANPASASPLEADFRLEDGRPLDVDALLALSGNDGRATYERATFDEGLGATVIANLRFADKDDGEGVLIERAELYGVDIEAIDRVTEGEGGPDAPFETIFEKVRLLNVSAEGFDDDEATFSIGGVEFDKLAVRRGGAESDSVGNEAARFFNAVSLGGLYLKDASLTMHKADAPNMTVLAPDLRVVGLAGGKLAGIIANGLEYEMNQTDASRAAMDDAMGPQAAILMNGPMRAFLAPANQRMKVRSLEWRGINLSGLMAWGLKGETPPASARDLIDLGVMKASEMESFIDDRRVATVGETSITAAKFAWLVPSDVAFDAKRAVTDFTAYAPETETEIVAVLKDHGLDNVASEGFAQWRWNPKNGAADLDYAANADGLADFSLAFGVDGAKLDAIAEAQANGDGATLRELAALRAFHLVLKDDTVLDVLFALSALQTGQAPEGLREAAPAMLRLTGAQFAARSPEFSDYIDAVANFIAEGGTLEIKAAPPEPVLLTSIAAMGAAPETLPDALGLTVTHTAK